MNDEISRIAGRMVHRADAALEFLEDVAARKRLLERRTDLEDSGRAVKLEDLNDRADRLARAANDYRKAEKIIRAFEWTLGHLLNTIAILESKGIDCGGSRDAARKAQEALK